MPFSQIFPPSPSLTESIRYSNRLNVEYIGKKGGKFDSQLFSLSN